MKHPVRSWICLTEHQHRSGPLPEIGLVRTGRDSGTVLPGRLDPASFGPDILSGPFEKERVVIFSGLLTGVAVSRISSILISSARRSNVTDVQVRTWRTRDETTWLALLENTTLFNRIPVANLGTRVLAPSTSFASRSIHTGFRDDQFCSCGHGRCGAYTPRVATCSIESRKAGNESARQMSSGEV